MELLIPRRLLALLLVSALLLTGCGAAVPAPSTQATTEPAAPTAAQPIAVQPTAAEAPAETTTPSTFVYLGYILAENIDPHTRSDNPGWLIHQGLYDGLLTFKPAGMELEPALATSWDVSADGLTYTFQLRQGVKFHDGTDFDAAAVKANFDRIMALKMGYSYMFTMVQSVEAVDPFVVKFTLKYPYAPFASNIPFLLMASPKAMQEHSGEGVEGTVWWGTHGIGTGPYRLESFSQGEQIVLTKFDQYFRGWDGKHVDRYVIKLVPEGATQRMMIEQGEAHMIDRFSFDDFDQMKANPKLTAYEFPSVRQYFHKFDTTKGPLTDKRVRQAIALAFDYDVFVTDINKGHAVVPRGLLPMSMPEHDSSIGPQKGDLAKAKQLLTEAGYPNGGFELTYMYLGPYDWQRMGGELLRDQLAQLGITLKLDGQPWATMVERMVDPAARPDITSVLVYPTSASADTLLYPMFHTDSGHYSNLGYSNQEVDRLLDLARQTVDADKRAEIYVSLQQLLLDEAPAVARATMTQQFVTTANVKGYFYQPLRTYIPPLYSMYIE